MDRNSHAKLTLMARDNRADAAQASALVQHYAKHGAQTSAALAAARTALVARRSVISRIRSFLGV